MPVRRDVDEDRRYEVKLTGTVATGPHGAGQLLQATASKQDRVTFPFSIDPATRIHAETPERPHRRQLSRRAAAEPLRRGAVLAQEARLPQQRRHVDQHRRLAVHHATQDARPLQRAVLRRDRPRGSRQPQFTGSVSWFLSGTRTGSHDIKGGVEHFTATNTRRQLAVGDQLRVRRRLPHRRRGQSGVRRRATA